jgi:hypothetical protein
MSKSKITNEQIAETRVSQLVFQRGNKSEVNRVLDDLPTLLVRHRIIKPLSKMLTHKSKQRKTNRLRPARSVVD